MQLQSSAYVLAGIDQLISRAVGGLCALQMGAHGRCLGAHIASIAGLAGTLNDQG